MLPIMFLLRVLIFNNVNILNSSSYSVIVRVREVLKRTVVGD